MPFVVETNRQPGAAMFAARIDADRAFRSRGLLRFTLSLGVALSLAEALVAGAGFGLVREALAVGAVLIWIAALAIRRSTPNCERIVIRDGELRLSRAGVAERRLRTFGLALEHDEGPDRGCHGLWLTLRDLRIEIARALDPAEREAFGALLEDAIIAAGGRLHAQRRARPAPAGIVSEPELTEPASL